MGRCNKDTVHKYDDCHIILLTIALQDALASKCVMGRPTLFHFPIKVSTSSSLARYTSEVIPKTYTSLTEIHRTYCTLLRAPHPHKHNWNGLR